MAQTKKYAVIFCSVGGEDEGYPDAYNCLITTSLEKAVKKCNEVFKETLTDIGETFIDLGIYNSVKEFVDNENGIHYGRTNTYSDKIAYWATDDYQKYRIFIQEL